MANREILALSPEVVSVYSHKHVVSETGDI